ncbi:MAG: response regulator transcription factor [Pseudomonadota bacterium]
MSAATILLVEDHLDLAEMLSERLTSGGYAVDFSRRGDTGLELALGNNYDLIVLDLSLPGLDGLEVCRRLREDAGDTTPILMLTARDTIEDRVSGLRAGADDYLVKPFAPEELLARVEAMLRRHLHYASSGTVTVGRLVLDPAQRLLTRDGEPIRLTPIGYRIVETLMRASPAYVSRSVLEKRVWGRELAESDSLRTHVYTVRKALDKPYATALLHSAAGAGYRIFDETAD